MPDQKSELMDRVKSKKKDIEARIAKAKADTKDSSNESIEELEKNLNEIQDLMEEAKDNASEEIARKLNKWLK